VESIVVTLQFQDKRLDLDLPAGIPIHQLIPVLVDTLRLPKTNAQGGQLRYRLLTMPALHTLDEQRTLSQSGIVAGRALSLQPIGASTATFATASGRIFSLDPYQKQLHVVGRADRGHKPDIDLGQEPGGEAVSRTHAQVYRQGQQWYIVQVVPNNLTQVGTTQLTPNQPHALHPGDRIVVGAVQCTFNVA
jgi:uncharacterized ubiquitin-like protein YukD